MCALDVVGIKLQDLAETLGRFYKLSSVHEDDAQVEVDDVGNGIQGYGLAEQGNGRLLVAGMMGQKAQQVMSLGMGRVRLKDLSIERFGPLKVAALVQFHSTLEQLRDGGHGFYCRVGQVYSRRPTISCKVMVGQAQRPA